MHIFCVWSKNKVVVNPAIIDYWLLIYLQAVIEVYITPKKILGEPVQKVL